MLTKLTEFLTVEEERKGGGGIQRASTETGSRMIQRCQSRPTMRNYTSTLSDNSVIILERQRRNDDLDHPRKHKEIEKLHWRDAVSFSSFTTYTPSCSGLLFTYE